MAQGSIRRLYQAFDRLEEAIRCSRKTLFSQQHFNLELLQKFADYEEILVQQRRLATKLCSNIVNDNWDQVRIQVSLLNRLAKQIHRDAILAVSEQARRVSESEQQDLSPGLKEQVG